MIRLNDPEISWPTQIIGGLVIGILKAGDDVEIDVDSIARAIEFGNDALSESVASEPELTHKILKAIEFYCTRTESIGAMASFLADGGDLETH